MIVCRTSPGATIPGARPGRGRIALVGNAPLRTDCSEAIDSCDLVVRCNEARTLGGFSGTRTDILCITNTGQPTEGFIAGSLSRPGPRFPDLSEVWFPRESGVHLRHLREVGSDLPGSEFLDRSDRILSANGLEGVRVTRFAASFNEHVFRMLGRESREDFLCPSTGFFALAYILARQQYASFDKWVFGFTFRMWKGHPAAAERRIALRLAGGRDDVFFVVPSAGVFARLRYRLMALPLCRRGRAEYDFREEGS